MIAFPQKDVPFDFGEQYGEAFHFLKTTLITPPSFNQLTGRFLLSLCMMHLIMH